MAVAQSAEFEAAVVAAVGSGPTELDSLAKLTGEPLPAYPKACRTHLYAVLRSSSMWTQLRPFSRRDKARE